MSTKGLLQRLNNGENILIAEGYIVEFERRGYIKSGVFVPEVVIERPDLVKGLHEEFIHAGSDVVIACTYYAHREKLRLVDLEDDLEEINLTALRIARQVADEHGKLMAGDICNTTIYKAGNPESIEKAKEMFKEQVQWAVQGGADYIVGETFKELGEAMLALEAIKQYGKGLPAVITFFSGMTDYTFDNIPIGEACRKLEEAGAAVVGLNCGRGPITLMSALMKVRKECKGPIAALPTTYRTTEKEPSIYALKVPGTDKNAFPVDVQTCLCTQDEIKNFAEEAKAIGVNYIGLCCGNSSSYFRIIADVYGREPPALKHMPDLSKHYMLGKSNKVNTFYAN